MQATHHEIHYLLLPPEAVEFARELFKPVPFGQLLRIILQSKCE